MIIPQFILKMVTLHHLTIFRMMKTLILNKNMKGHHCFNHMVSVLVKLLLRYLIRNGDTHPLTNHPEIEGTLTIKAGGIEVLKPVERRIVIPITNDHQIIDLLEGTVGNILRRKILLTLVQVAMITESTLMIFL